MQFSHNLNNNIFFILFQLDLVLLTSFSGVLVQDNGFVTSMKINKIFENVLENSWFIAFRRLLLSDMILLKSKHNHNNFYVARSI